MNFRINTGKKMLFQKINPSFIINTQLFKHNSCNHIEVESKRQILFFSFSLNFGSEPRFIVCFENVGTHFEPKGSVQ